MIKKISGIISTLFFIFLFFLSCTDDKSTKTFSKSDNTLTENKQDTFIYNVIPDDPSASISPEYSEAINTFSINLLKEAYSNFAGQNLILSPFCLSRNLAVLAEGTTGDSRQELLDILGGQSALDDARNALTELLYADSSVF